MTHFCSWFDAFLAFFSCPQAIRKALAIPLLITIEGVWKSPGDNKHEKVHALKRELSACLFSPSISFPDFSIGEQERKALNYTLLFICQSIVFCLFLNYLFRPFGQFVHISFRNEAVGKTDEQLLLGIINGVVI